MKVKRKRRKEIWRSLKTKIQQTLAQATSYPLNALQSRLLAVALQITSRHGALSAFGQSPFKQLQVHRYQGVNRFEAYFVLRLFDNRWPCHTFTVKGIGHSHIFANPVRLLRRCQEVDACLSMMADNFLVCRQRRRQVRGACGRWRRRNRRN